PSANRPTPTVRRPRIEGGCVGGGGPIGAGSSGSGPTGGGGGGSSESPSSDCVTGGAGVSAGGFGDGCDGGLPPMSPRWRRLPPVISASAQIRELGRNVQT